MRPVVGYASHDTSTEERSPRMAQTRTKSGGSTRSTSRSRRSNGSQAASTSRRSNGSSSTRATASGRGARASKRTSPKRASGAATKSRQAKSRQAEETRQGTSFGDVVSKAKTPLLAGGAAAAGLIGGVALSRNNGKKGVSMLKGVSMPKIGAKRQRKTPSVSMPKLPKPKLGSGDNTSKALGATAKAL